MSPINRPGTGKADASTPKPSYGPPDFKTHASGVKPDSRELLKALNGTSQSARTSWLSFVTLMAFLLIAVTSVTHADLLLNTPVKLPMLQIEVGLRGFFVVAPVMFILVHFGVLLHHAMLRQKAVALNALLEEDEKATPVQPLRLEVSSYFFAQGLSGPKRSGVLYLLVRSMSILTLGLLPLCLLLAFQIAFLSAHDPYITFLHRVYVLIDGIILLVVVGGSRIAAPTKFWRSLFDIARTSIRATVGNFVAPILVLFLSFAVATIPAQKDDPYSFFEMDRLFTGLAPTKVPFQWDHQTCEEWRGDRCVFWLTAVISEQPVDYVSGRSGFFSRNLVITDNQSLLPQRPLNEGEPRIRLRGRDLRFATFDRSDLRGVDFTATDLTGANLRGPT